MTDLLLPSARRYHVLVNTHAGAVLEVGGAVLRERLDAAFTAAGACAEVHLGDWRELQARLVELADPLAIPVIIGGDGTVLALLPTLLSRGLPFALLPMGTMNLLGRDLGLVGDLEIDVKALHTGRTRAARSRRSTGCRSTARPASASRSSSPTSASAPACASPFSLALATAVAAVRALIRTRPIEVEVEVEVGERTQRLVADAVLVTNNVFEGSPWRRPRLRRGHPGGAPPGSTRLPRALARRSRDHDRQVAGLAPPHQPARRQGEPAANPGRTRVTLRRRGHPAAGYPRLCQRAPGAAILAAHAPH